ncbi:MAG: glycosyltransferase family 4 protein [Limisphaerales bacterium]
MCSLVRGSAHILAQSRLLAAEEKRCGRPLEQPSGWMIAREMREYHLADLVVVLSSFAAKTFLDEGFPQDKLRILPLGTDVRRFRPDVKAVRERCRRMLSGECLRVLTVGSFTYQKGMYDLARIAHQLDGPFRFKFVGDCPQETRRLRAECRDIIQFVPRQPQSLLPRQYAEGDLFLFTTIQDGYAAVLAQAYAASLPILTTPNCAGPDLVQEAETGWVLPVRSPEAFIERLRWCDTHRAQLATIVWNAYQKFRPRDWGEVASDLQRIFRQAIQRRRAR